MKRDTFNIPFSSIIEVRNYINETYLNNKTDSIPAFLFRGENGIFNNTQSSFGRMAGGNRNDTRHSEIIYLIHIVADNSC
jgi:hypothetical protein